MVIRHAEKPDDADPDGLTEAGRPDSESLTARGWERAKALVGLFAPKGENPRSGLAIPGSLFASAPGPQSNSQRPIETITPLARKLALQIDTRFVKGQGAEVAAAATQTDGVVLICWQHEEIPEIALAIKADGGGIPNKWPGKRFDMVWVFDLLDGGNDYSFSQIAQELLDGDKSEGIQE
jgi:hypothetical protein